jgi:hypothetical protein
MVARSEQSDPASHAMIWMGAASPPSCGVAGVRGRQRSAISVSAWDGPPRRAAHAQTGPGVRSERYICGCVRRAAASRRTAAARSGIFGLTIRDPSCLPLDGRRNPAGMRPTLRGEATRFLPLRQGSGWALPLRQAAGFLASVGDSEARFRRPHGTALCGERRKRGPDLACDPSVIHAGASAEQLRAAAQRRQGPGSSDGRFVTLRVCHWMAVGIRQVCGRLSAAKPCVCSATKCVRLRRRGCDAFGCFVHSAWVWRVWPVAIRRLESDLRSGQRRENRPNVLALALR